MASERSRQLAACAWTTAENSRKVMDPALCEAFAKILDSELKDATASMTPSAGEEVRAWVHFVGSIVSNAGGNLTWLSQKKQEICAVADELLEQLRRRFPGGGVTRDVSGESESS